ncbi:MAG: DUF6173 family protein [Pseudomonadota bacterium]
MEYKIGGKLRTEPVFPQARVARTDCADEDCAENQPLPSAMTKVAPEQKSPARWAYERLILYVQNFEKQLDGDHEVAMGFAGSEAGSIHIMGMGYFDPDLITFYGADPSGSKTQLIQHVSELNVMLRAAPKQHKEARRIGFEMSRKLEEDDAAEETTETG